jgi:hypothetical protein
LEWFRKIVDAARRRGDSEDSTPWIGLIDAKGNPFFFNFQTNLRCTKLPGSLSKQNKLGDVMQIADSDIEVLKFTSWWTEGKKKRYLRLSYFMSTEDFEVRIDDDDNVYRVPTLKGKHGNLRCTDLHLMCTVYVFGRAITLWQCSSETRKWLETNTQQLLDIKHNLEAQLSKYQHIKTSATESQKPLASFHIQSLIREIAKLKNKLAECRPVLAQKYQIASSSS